MPSRSWVPRIATRTCTPRIPPTLVMRASRPRPFRSGQRPSSIEWIVALAVRVHVERSGDLAWQVGSQAVGSAQAGEVLILQLKLAAGIPRLSIPFELG